MPHACRGEFHVTGSVGEQVKLGMAWAVDINKEGDTDDVFNVCHWRKFDRMSLHNNLLDVELPASANREKSFHPELAGTNAARLEAVTYAVATRNVEDRSEWSRLII